MVDAYVQVAIFALIALFIPLAALLFSRLVRPQSRNNAVETLPYESSEESVGQRVEIMHEYLHYFTIFLVFEIISVIAILWSTFSRQVQSATGAYITLLLLFGFVLEVFMFAVLRGRGD